MIGLLQDPSIAQFDIIAIQEPWRNKHDHATYNPRDSPFTVIDSRSSGSRVCTYINKRIAPSSWSATIHSGDAQSIRMILAGEEHNRRTDPTGEEYRRNIVHIHNVYSPPPASHADTNESASTQLLPTMLSDTGEHILVGDFNLHHPLWGGPAYPQQHILADTLIEHIREAGLELILPQGTITRDVQRGQYIERTTIDLAFATDILAKRVVRCQKALEIE